MKFYNLLIKYRLWASIAAFLLSLALNVFGLVGFWPIFPIYFIAVIGLVSEFLIGPMRLIQEPMEAGNIEEVQRIIASIKYPNLLIKPIRSSYFAVKGNLAMMNKDFGNAEKFLKESSSLGSAMPMAEGNNKLQLGMMALQQGNFKDGESHMRAALKIGLPDKESQAVAYLSMCQIYMQKRHFPAAKDFFRKAKECKPKTQQVVDQMKELEKYLARV